MSNDIPKIRLRPVIYTNNTVKSSSQDTTQQMFLLKALQITQDPKKLRAMIGVRSVAEVYRTLDKLAMRKEYHEALSRAGLSFDYIVGGIKGIADGGYKDSDKLKAFQILLKSVGMDEYKEQVGALTGTWEEELLKRIEEGKVKDDVKKLNGPIVYDVQIPVVPESERLKQDEEKEIGTSIYDNK